MSYKKRINVGLTLAVLMISGACAKKDTHVTNGNGATFFVDSVSATFAPDELNSNEVVNRKFINFTACIKDNAQQSAVMNLRFQVTAGAVTTTKKTDDRGCIVWQELFTYDPYEDEKQIPLTRSITAVQGHSGTEVVQLAYDPWDSDNLVFTKREAVRELAKVDVLYTHGGEVKTQNARDGRPVENNSVTVDIQTTVVSKRLKHTYITNMTMQFLKRDFDQYAVNQNLNLTIAHQYRLKFSSSAVRKSLSQGLVAQNINAGRFKVYFVLLKEGYDAKNVEKDNLVNYVISANQIETTASMGRVIQDTTLKFTNIAALASRLTGIMTINSADDQTTFAESSFEGTLAPVAGGLTQSIDLIDSPLNARDLFEKYNTALAAEVKSSTLDLFNKYSGYQPMPPQPVKVQLRTFFGLSHDVDVDLMTLFRKKKAGQTLTTAEQSQFATALCHQYFDGSGNPALQNAYDLCMRHPDQMMTSEIRSFVDKLNAPTIKKVGLPHVESLTVSSSVNFNTSNSMSSGARTTKSMSVYANAGVEAGAAANLKTPGVSPLTAAVGASAAMGGKLSIGREWFSIAGVTKTSSNITGNDASRSMVISSESFKFAIDLSTRSCLLIAPSPELVQAMNGATHVQGKYLCDEQIDQKTQEEEYFFLNQATGLATSPMSDNLSSEDNPFRMFIRGRETYNRFMTVFAQKGLDIVLQKVPDSELPADFRDFYITQDFPGMLSQ